MHVYSKKLDLDVNICTVERPSNALSTHSVHMQYTCSTHAAHMQYTC